MTRTGFPGRTHHGVADDGTQESDNDSPRLDDGERTFFLPVRGDPGVRLAVYAELSGVDGGLLDLAEEECTSASPTAQRLESPSNAVRRFCVTRREAAWLRDVLISLNLGEPEVAVVASVVRGGRQ